MPGGRGRGGATKQQRVALSFRGAATCILMSLDSGNSSSLADAEPLYETVMRATGFEEEGFVHLYIWGGRN